MFVDEKQLICSRAVPFIRPNDCIYIDHSTTALNLCSFIKNMLTEKWRAISGTVAFLCSNRYRFNSSLRCAVSIVTPSYNKVYSTVCRMAMRYAGNRAYISIM